MRAARTADVRAEPADCYVYGLLAPDDLERPEPQEGVGGRPVEVMAFDGYAALISPQVDREAFGLPADLLAHTRVLDEVAATRTVVPVAFGTFLPCRDTDDRSSEALRRAFDAAVGRIDGAVQFTLTVRYRQDVVLAELVREDRQIARLREETAGTPDSVRRAEKLRLGELVVQGLDRKAQDDSSRILEAVTPFTRATAVRERRQSDEVVELATLVERSSAAAFEEACDGLAATFADRASFRLLGPQAPYDFVRQA